MLKKEARRIYRNKREAVSPSDKMKWDDLLLIQLQAITLPDLNYVLSFYPFEGSGEPDTFPITDFLHFRNPSLHICYPRTDLQHRTMQAIACSADSIFEANAYNIPEPTDTAVIDPEQIDLVFVPLLAFDEKGHRAGYGKGFYDRFLQHCRKDCIKAGLSYFEPLPSLDDADGFDVPLDLCITPQRTYVF